MVPCVGEIDYWEIRFTNCLSLEDSVFRNKIVIFCLFLGVCGVGSSGGYIQFSDWKNDDCLDNTGLLTQTIFVFN